MSNKTKAELEYIVKELEKDNECLAASLLAAEKKYADVPHGERCNNRLGFLCNCHKSKKVI